MGCSPTDTNGWYQLCRPLIGTLEHTAGCRARSAAINPKFISVLDSISARWRYTAVVEGWTHPSDLILIQNQETHNFLTPGRGGGGRNFVSGQFRSSTFRRGRWKSSRKFHGPSPVQLMLCMAWWTQKFMVDFANCRRKRVELQVPLTVQGRPICHALPAMRVQFAQALRVLI